MMTQAALLLFLAAGSDANLLANPDFSDGLSGWYVDAPGILAEARALDNRSVATLTVGDDEAVGWPRFGQNIPCEAGDVFELTVLIRGENVREGHGAYAALEFMDKAGRRIAHEQSGGAPRDGSWTPMTTRGICPENAVEVRVALLLNGRGVAFFDDAVLTRRGRLAKQPVEGPVTLTVTDTVTCKSLFGMGFEDDGWRYNEMNAGYGVSEADYALCERRLAWLNPSWVRMFFWWSDFNPSHDWKTYTWDSDNMQSRYRTLDVYQRLGTEVTVTGVEWGMDDPFAHVPEMASAVGDLLEHLVKVKGYTCIKHWILTNEPNLHFTHGSATFEDYVELHRLVKAEIDRRGLDIKIMGSDDTNGGLPWFRDCVTDPVYFETADLFSSHRYIDGTARDLARYVFEDRLDLLRGRKPLVMAEFGFRDARSGVTENPIMEEYAYALWALEFAFEGLNQGVAGFSIWSVHEMYYPGSIMNYALWNFKDRDWSIRPVYHAWAMLTRFARPGDKVLRTTSTHPGSVFAATVGDTLFWANAAADTVDIKVVGADLSSVQIMTEDRLQGDAECGDALDLTAPAFSAPARSFGYGRITSQ